MGPGIITIVFPNSGAPGDLENEAALLAAINERGRRLFQQLGGVLPMA